MWPRLGEHGEGGPAAIDAGGGCEAIVAEGQGEGARVGPGSSEEVAGGVRESIGVIGDFLRGEGLALGEVADEGLGGDAGEVDIRVGVDQISGGIAGVGGDAAVVGEGLGEAALLEGDVAQAFGGLIAPGAEKCLIEEAAQGGGVTCGECLAVPGFGPGVDAAAVEGAGLGRHFRDAALAILANLDVKDGAGAKRAGLVAGDLGHGGAVLVDDAEVKVDGLVPLAAAGLGGGVAEEVFGVEAGIGAEGGTPAEGLGLSRGRVRR